MKKIVCLLSLCLAFILVFTACAPKAAVEPVNAKEFGCVYFPGTDWGMSEKELYEALGKTAGDFEITEKTEKGAEGEAVYTSTELFSKEIEFEGKTYEGRFVFTSFPDSDDKRLSQVVILYDMGEKTVDEFEAKIGEFFKSQKVEFTSKSKTADGQTLSTRFKSEACLSGLPQKMRDGVNGYCRDYFSDETDETTLNRLSKIDDFTIAYDDSLSSVFLQYGNDGECGIFFNGDVLVRAQMCAEAYEQSQN